jgi:deoxyribodipyrimidine photo-lyase
MRELFETGYMHNRVRMITASFLVKNLGMDWRLGEAYFASMLMDFDLASNNGNWQWVAGTGCDSSPYFRVFNPITQQEKFDPKFEYCMKWLPEMNEDGKYPVAKIVDVKTSRLEAIERYKSCVS